VLAQPVQGGRGRVEEKGKETMTSPDLTVQDVIDDLGSFYCHNVMASLWADALANRLEGMAIYLLSDELPEVAEHVRAAARCLADRAGDLGGAAAWSPNSHSQTPWMHCSPRQPHTMSC
jgi:hypothetical protein